MSTIKPLIIDAPVPYAQHSAPSGSLLLLPMGHSRVLDHLVPPLIGLREVTAGEVLVLPTFPVTPEYEQGLTAQECPVRIVQPAEISTIAHNCETSDFLLVVEAAHWPVAGHYFDEVIHRLPQYRGATHVVAIGADTDATREIVECDDSGRVKRVQRFYNVMSWPEVAGTSIIYSLVPGRALADIRFGSLMELRAGLAARGLLSRDLPVHTDVVDLADESGYLTLSERMVGYLARQPAEGYASPVNEVLVGDRCRIDPSARLIPPVVIQPGVTIEQGVTIIGPALVGSGSTIGRGTTVVQSVLASHTVVSPETVIRHRMVSGDCAAADLVPDADDNRQQPANWLDAAPQEDELAEAADPVAGKQIHLVLKRAFDIVFSLLALLMLSPLFLLIAVLVKRDGGPVLFAHQREGKGGRQFPCIKFRTMIPDAHRKQRELYKLSQVDGPQFKIDRDPRVTRVGRWLRATNIDELPQLINVLIGDMSLVGPRPSPFRENQICVPWRRARLSVRPGITGLWQVCRDDRSSGDFHQWIYYDMMYVRHFTFWLDLKILGATILTLGGKWSVPMNWIIGREPRRKAAEASFLAG